MNTDNHLLKDNSSVPGRTNDPETFAKFASVKSYQDYLTDKDNPVVMVTLTVNDQGFLDNTTFETYLTQHTNAHDEFTIVVSDTAIDDFYGQVMRNSKNLLGEPITIYIHHKGAVVQSFKGIIAQVSDKRNEGGGYGNLYISGYGLSILLDSGEECQSYEDKTLPKIIAEATNEYGDVKVNTKGMVNTKYKIPYVVQYKESDYQFIQRLARRYGEFFFYDGTQLQFNNETRQTVQLSEGDDLIEVAFELKIQPQHFSYLSYGVEKGEVEEKNTKNVRLQDKGNPFQFAAVKASEKVFTKKTKVPYNAFTEEFRGDYLADNVRREKESREQLMEVRGRSRNPNLRIGGFVKLKDINDKPMESYRIIDIKHHQSGYDYENEFVAIPDVYIAYYYDREALPRAEQQIARVTDNNDPKGLGRVRVQFIWQVAKKLQTPWIRVVQPHAGGGKGFYFIPEIGEEVLVDFEDQNAERPFVVGSHYNGKEYSPFHNTNNDIKAIQTRSGHKLIFTEDESILLSDKNGNTLRFDTQGKNIEISAPESISLCAGKDINLSAGNNLLMDVANVASFNILQQLLVNTPYMKQLITELFHTQAGKALINSNDQIKIEARETNVAGTEKLLVHSDRNATLNSKGVLSVKGEQGNKISNRAEEFPTEEIILNSNCIVHFRPKKNWQGEFGFDWFRIGDTGMDGDTNYEDIIGQYYTLSIIDANTVINQNPNSWTPFFKKDPQIPPFINYNRLEKLKDLYGKYYYQKNDKNIGITKKRYYRPYLAIFPKEEDIKQGEIKLTLHLEYLDFSKENLPDKLIFEINEPSIKIRIEGTSLEQIFITNYILADENHSIVSIDKHTILKKEFSEKINIRLICKKNFQKDEDLFVWGIKTDDKGKEIDRKLAGVLRIISPMKINPKEIVMIKVKTKAGLGRNKDLDEMVRILKQCLISPKITKDIILDLSETDFETKFNVVRRNIPNSNVNGLKLEDYLIEQLNNKYPDCFTNHFKLFFLANTYRERTITDAEGKTIITRVNGYSNINTDYGLMFRSHSKTTIVHEFMHGLGLHHSFFGEDYVYEALKTDNIMDYSHLSIDPVQNKPNDRIINRISTWFWQWCKVNIKIS